MIPALVAAPLVEGVLGQVIGSLMPSSAAQTPTTAPFSPYMKQAIATSPAMSTGTPVGTMRSDEWNQMSSSDMKTWAGNLAGRHVDVTDETGKTISGVVDGVQQVGDTLALNVSGHLVSLSQLKQISWSPSAV